MSLDDKRAAAIAYLRERKLHATQLDSEFRYTDSNGTAKPKPPFLRRPKRDDPPPPSGPTNVTRLPRRAKRRDDTT